MRVKRRYPRPLSLISIFMASFSLFYFMPPLLLRSPAIASFFNVLGSFNAKVHMWLLGVFGIESAASSNLLYLPSGAVLQYSPYCFGFLTVTGFSILVFAAPSLHMMERLNWIVSGSLFILIVNQMRIFFELLIAIAYPLGVSTVDMLLYPVLPGIALFMWYSGLKSYRAELWVRGEDHAEG